VKEPRKPAKEASAKPNKPTEQERPTKEQREEGQPKKR
jgi:hypothetical protein